MYKSKIVEVKVIYSDYKPGKPQLEKALNVVKQIGAMMCQAYSPPEIRMWSRKLGFVGQNGPEVEKLLKCFKGVCELSPENYTAVEAATLSIAKYLKENPTVCSVSMAKMDEYKTLDGALVIPLSAKEQKEKDKSYKPIDDKAPSNQHGMILTQYDRQRHEREIAVSELVSTTVSGG
jgi:hypothetical protein